MSKLETLTLTLPQHWAGALLYGDCSGLEDDEEAAVDAFVEDMTDTHGSCLCMSVEDDASFTAYHDAQPFGVLACDACPFVFDVTPQSNQ